MKMHKPHGKQWGDMSLLVLLYGLQGSVMGLCMGSVPFMLQSKLSYTALGVLSTCSYPYSLKMLWAPLVDCFWIKSIGRRKTWILASQILAGLFLLLLASELDFSSFTTTESIPLSELAISFFALIFLIGTQDIAVDGWAVDLLKGDNVGKVSSCQSIGITVGYFLSFTGFLFLHSRNMISLPAYCTAIGWLFLFVSAALAIGKPEEDVSSSDVDSSPSDSSDLNSFKTPPSSFSSSIGSDSGLDSLKSVFKKLAALLKLKNMQSLAVFLLISRIGFVAPEALSSLKLVEMGFSRESLASMMLFSVPTDVVTAFIVGKFMSSSGSVSSRSPFSAWNFGYIMRLFAGFFSLCLVWSFPTDAEAIHSASLYAIIVVLTIFSNVALGFMFLSIGTFFAETADASLGASHMTLLNTLSNLGGTWPKFFVFWLVDQMTLKSCDNAGHCAYIRDGFYVVCGASLVLSIALYFVYVHGAVNKLKTLRKKDFHIADDDHVKK